MLRWNHYCDKHDREGDCILLNEDRTYVEAFESREQAMKEIVNSQEATFRRCKGFLVPIWESRLFRGMMYVPQDDIGKWIDLDLMGLD